MRNATFVGRVTRAPKLVNGNTAPISVAVNESYKNKETGEYEPKSYFITSWAYGKTAEYAEKNLRPGDLVSVEARVGTKTNDQNHTEGYSFSVQNLTMVQRGKREESGITEAPPF